MLAAAQRLAGDRPLAEPGLAREARKLFPACPLIVETDLPFALLEPFRAHLRGNPHAAGEIYQRLSRSRSTGLHYTPLALARLLLGELVEPRPLRWLDPACGCGVFGLVLREICRRQGDLPPQAFWAGDVDRAALQVFEASWRAGGSREADPQLEPPLLQDALSPFEELPPSWREGFDRVVMNPPFSNGVEEGGPDRETRSLLRSRFRTARGPFDLHVPFVERALELLKPGGRLGVILPDKWLSASFGQSLREYLADQAVIHSLHHFPQGRLFGGAALGALLLVAEKRCAAESGPVAQVFQRRDDLVETAAHQVEHGEWKELAREGWGPLLQKDRRRLLPRRPIARLGDDRPVRASLSVGEYYALPLHEQEELPQGLPLLSSGAIDPWRSHWGRRPLRIRGRDWTRPVLHPATLTEARREQAATHRVLVANMSRRLEALAIGPGEGIGVVNVIQVPCKGEDEAQLLCAWLNSPAVDRWMRLWYDPLRMNGQLSLTRSMVSRIPLPPDDPDVRQALLVLGLRLRERPDHGPALRELEALCDRAMERLVSGEGGAA